MREKRSMPTGRHSRNHAGAQNTGNRPELDERRERVDDGLQAAQVLFQRLERKRAVRCHHVRLPRHLKSITRRRNHKKVHSGRLEVGNSAHQTSLWRRRTDLLQRIAA